VPRPPSVPCSACGIGHSTLILGRSSSAVLLSCASNQLPEMLTQSCPYVDASGVTNAFFRLLGMALRLHGCEVVDQDTGTTFLLGSQGLTVIRRLNVENDYKNNKLRSTYN
jgi:hypothetical protein